jgi:protein-S-isoprenylcysteine O-methyltransferase Ste14
MSALGNALLAAFYLRFAWIHLSLATTAESWTLPPLVLQETLLVFLCLTRRRSIATSGRVDDWATGVVGWLLPLLMRPTEAPGPLAMLGVPLQVIGLALAVVGAASIGRSIGIVAAHRGLQTHGLYRVVRHPMYAAYLVSYVGYAATYPSTYNLLIATMTIVGLHLRAVGEERFLARDPGYRAYLATVRWRFVPAVY